MVFSYKRENRSTTILMVCSSSHLLLQLSGSSAALEGESKNLGLGSSHVSKREYVFSISCFTMSILQIWGGNLVIQGKDVDWFSLGICTLNFTLCPPWWDPQRWDLSSTQVWLRTIFSRVTLTARCFLKITTLYLLVEIYHTHWGFKDADENNAIAQLHFT